MDPRTPEIKALEVASGDPTRALVTGHRVYDPLIYAPEVVQFSIPQYLFLSHYRAMVPLEEAATRAGMTPESAERFLQSDKARGWLADRARKDSVQQKWSAPEEWYALGSEVLEGDREFSKAQLEIYKEFGDRCVPKPSRNGEQQTKIEIHFDPEKVRAALDRQKVIEAEIEEELKHAV